MNITWDLSLPVAEWCELYDMRNVKTKNEHCLACVFAYGRVV